MSHSIEDISEELSNIKEDFYYNMSLNDDAALQRGILLADRGSMVAAVIVFLIALAIYFGLSWFGVSQFNAAVVSILGVLASILYAVDAGGASIQRILLFLRADSREHYKALHKYQELTHSSRQINDN